MGSEDTPLVGGFRVHGRVQGVGFRWWARQTACTLGLRGEVRNCPDGCVEVIAVGTKDQVERFTRALERGPPASRVDRIEAFEPEAMPAADAFEITR